MDTLPRYPPVNKGLMQDFIAKNVTYVIVIVKLVSTSEKC